MKLYCEDEDFKLYGGNMLDMAEIIEPASIDAIITDPPYELNFMGKGWDNSGIAFQADTWRKCYDALKSGGYLLAFGGSRTFHRIAVAIEDAGFEIRDVIMYMYGSGFPKSMNLGKAIESKLTTGSANTQEWKNLNGTKEESGNWGLNKNAHEYGARPAQYDADGHLRTVEVEYTTEEGKKWDGWGSALKPSYEPIIVARKPCENSLTDNVLKYGVGGVNIDECRIGTEKHKVNINDFSNQHGNKFGNGEPIEKMGEKEVTGRFPANIILTYDDTDFDEVCGNMPDTSSNGGKTTMPVMGGGDMGVCNYATIGADRAESNYIAPKDAGNACRYFYCAKASKKDRDEGLLSFETVKTGELQGGRAEGSAGSIMQNKGGGTRVNPYAGAGTPKRNTHPTVKPTSLMQYLVRLIAPAGAVILDPFNGSGSTGKAVMFENTERNKGYKYIGIELTEEYLPIAKARIEFGKRPIPDEQDEIYKDGAKQMNIFDFIE